MDETTQTLVQILVKDVVLPEVLALLHRNVPDEGAIYITLSKDKNRVKAFGQAFLDETRQG